MPWRKKPSKSNRKNDILVIRAPYCMKAEVMERQYKGFIQQMRSGLVMLPPGFSAAFCPPGVEVKFMDASNDIFEEGDHGT